MRISRPKAQSSFIEVALLDTDMEILSFLGEGDINFIALRFSDDDVEVSVMIDGVESYRYDLKKLEGDLDLKDDEYANSPITGGRSYKEVFCTPAQFSKSFKVFARKTDVNKSVDFVSGLVRHTEKI